MLRDYSSNQCDICCGRHTCFYCGNVKADTPKRSKELEMIDVYYNNGRMVNIIVPEGGGSYEIEEITRDMVMDIGAIVTTKCYEARESYLPFWPSVGTYGDILRPLIKQDEIIGKIVTVPAKLNGITKKFTKIISFEVLKNGQTTATQGIGRTC